MPTKKKYFDFKIQDDDDEDAEEEFVLAKKEKSLKYMMMEDSGKKDWFFIYALLVNITSMNIWNIKRWSKDRTQGSCLWLIVHYQSSLWALTQKADCCV